MTDVGVVKLKNKPAQPFFPYLTTKMTLLSIKHKEKKREKNKKKKKNSALLDIWTAPPGLKTDTTGLKGAATKKQKQKKSRTRTYTYTSHTAKAS